MTDLLTPEDTGEIPAVDPGLETRNLADYLATGPFPVLRRGELLDEVPYEPHTIGVVDDFQPTAPGPDPTPPLPPPPPPTPGYRARHRAPGRWWTPLVEAYACLYARMRGAR